MINDTIAAISSGGKINQAISIIRVSGQDSIEIVSKIFKGKIGTNQTITYGHIFDNKTKEIIDEVLIAWFIGNKNFTGENTVEINCHGGVLVTNRILELLLANGARMALPGEFSRRSFLNGKMDLIKAEAINDLIHAKTLKQSELAIKKFDGKTSNMIKSFIDELAYLIGQMEINIDYPEYEDFENVLTKDLISRLQKLQDKLSLIIKESENSRLIFDGIKVAILGKPNVGKSSILNCLINEDKAIVTDQAGTTRDIVEASYQIDGLLFKLVDTAGIRKTNRKIEKIGIEKSFEQIEKCDVVIHVNEANTLENDYDKKVEKLAKQFNKPLIKAINKVDLLKNNKKKKNVIYVSAKNKNIDDLKEALVNIFSKNEINNEEYVVNARQLALIKKAHSSISDAIESINSGIDVDVVIIDVRQAWADLVDISGRADNELLLDEMFKNFCLGK
ncbi:tRNA uridine-5-carboxymethylaminomethyl(34) synthesis GTPase MnmE [Mycoplasmopsis fermentans]|uniref:tRNA uridine-5-carboxymethylaminomethyl(34) synthesis GTPase MnmE n=1 Tax=Mycoplasmopsis fermentans TaxID=2115 RepID=UPI000F03C946|nr:tRNA uridine-5-carboxymethylaminomethyl(34) synthesis GTPase MnmE [Mycoplasmopsis fermentans]RMX34807.1 tRNA modification GTPase TrmE [Mycoplasmopsis fermentans MF-I1]RMX34871.1 tRNA modification GTPase TrmE [Mycoplasmopsis fermentans MF-I2]